MNLVGELRNVLEHIEAEKLDDAESIVWRALAENRLSVAEAEDLIAVKRGRAPSKETQSVEADSEIAESKVEAPPELMVPFEPSAAATTLGGRSTMLMADVAYPGPNPFVVADVRRQDAAKRRTGCAVTDYDPAQNN